MARMAWVEGKNVQNEINDYRAALKLLDPPAAAAPRADLDSAWAALKRKKRG
jgi:hypothetical protein